MAANTQSSSQGFATGANIQSDELRRRNVAPVTAQPAVSSQSPPEKSKDKVTSASSFKLFDYLTC
jgi:hypothetical protein